MTETSPGAGRCGRSPSVLDPHSRPPRLRLASLRTPRPPRGRCSALGPLAAALESSGMADPLPSHERALARGPPGPPATAGGSCPRPSPGRGRVPPARPLCVSACHFGDSLAGLVFRPDRKLPTLVAFAEWPPATTWGIRRF